MDIGNVISDSLRYPSSDWSKVIVLGVIFIISFLIIPLFLAVGYMFRVIKASLAGVEELPPLMSGEKCLLMELNCF